MYTYLCDFAKRCKFSLEHGHRPCSSQCSRKKPGGLAVLLGVSGEPGPDLTVGDWLVFFVSKNRGVERRDFVTLIRVSSQKALQSQVLFPVR